MRTQIDKSPMWTEHRDENGNVIRELVEFDRLPYEERYMWYSSICSDSEIKRILDMKTGQDYILRLRADEIIANMRIYRVVLAHARNARLAGREWSLEGYFNAYGYVDFKNSLDPEKLALVQDVAFGNIFTNEINGLIFQSPFGVCSTLSHALRYFVKFADLAMMEFGREIPFSVRTAAMRIAVRTMLGQEALDFDLDPRGIIPEDIKKSIMAPYPFISTFIAGHEYSHLINGDLKGATTFSVSLMKAHFEDDTDYRKVDVYNVKQKHEFAADLGAMNYPKFDDSFYAMYYRCVLLWFAMMTAYEAAEDSVNPICGSPSHPGAKARYQYILDNARRPIDFAENEEYYTKQLPELASFWEEFIRQDVAEHYDEIYDMKGSIYLAAPNTEWRGRELIDRVDY